MKFKTHIVNWDNGKSKYEWFCNSCNKFKYDEDKEELHTQAKKHYEDCVERYRQMREENPEEFRILAHIKGWGNPNETDNVSNL